MIINYKECEMDTTISYKPNPKRNGSKAYTRYKVYSKATTLQMYFDICIEHKYNSHMRADLRYDEEKGYLVLDIKDKKLNVLQPNTKQPPVKPKTIKAKSTK